MKKLSQKVEESKGESLVARSIPAKGVVIGEKCSKEDSISSLSKKGNAVDSSKGKKDALVPEAKKR